jgi:hypothetical protein
MIHRQPQKSAQQIVRAELLIAAFIESGLGHNRSGNCGIFANPQSAQLKR